MKTPCELIVKTVLPTIRASIAKELIEEHGMTQKETARILGLTTPAVSQYLSMKRATKRNMKAFKSKEFDQLVGEAARVIMSEPDEIGVMRAICHCCLAVRSNKLLCSMHEAIAPQLRGCTFCMEVGCRT